MPLHSRYEKLARLFPKTLIPEFRRIFGDEVTEKLLTVFAGTTIHVPSIKEQENAFRDIIIFETLERSEGASESRRLGENLSSQYGISRRRVRHIYRVMRRLRKANKIMVEADQATGQHKKSKTVKTRSRLRGL